MDVAIISLEQVGIMMFFMAIGYLFRKKNIFDEKASITLSRLVVNVFLPAMTFLTFVNNFKTEIIREKSQLLLMSLCVLTVTGALAVLLSKIFSKNKATQAVYIYSFTIPNLGYMGYPLVKAVFGESALLDTMIYCIPYNIYIYTVGTYILTNSGDGRKISLKALFNPTLVALALGMAAGLMNIKLPSFVEQVLRASENCMSPCAMLLTGAVFARIDLKSMLLDVKSYTASAIRLIIIPLIFLVILKMLKLPDNWILASVAILAMPLGLNSVVFPEAYGGDSETGAKVCFMASVLGIITIPIVFGLL